jgi:hypothetical protein
MATTVNIYEAKAKLSKLVDLASQGEDIIIAKTASPLPTFLNFLSATHPEIKESQFAFGALALAKLLSQGIALVLLFINFRLAKGTQKMI